MPHGTLLAALDLGSNHFRLEIGRAEHGQIQRVEHHQETVRQGSGLDAHGHLSAAALQRGWDCLARFAERLVCLAPAQVRAVATQTLREARNREVFLARGSQILGHPIEVISGAEEAHLVYQGVARLLPPSNEQRLVIDIGGRSTELILGQQLSARAVASFEVGSVAWSARYFAQGHFSPQAFASAECAAQAALGGALGVYRRSAWETAYGASGTVRAVGCTLAAASRPAGRITRADLDWLQERLLQAQNASCLQLDGLLPEHRPVIGGGISVLRALFDLLGIDTLHVAQGALRQGVLYGLLAQPLA